MSIFNQYQEKLNPKNIAETIKHRNQRANRGWSDRDTWNGGEHILSVTSGVLKKLGDEKSHIDWDGYFKNNYQTRGYNSLDEVAKDIDDYLAFDDYGWVDKLGFEIKNKSVAMEEGLFELKSGNTLDEERRIRIAIRKHQEEWKQRYDKMKNAMIFVSTNIPSLWD